MARPLLQVTALHPADAEAAEAGGADQLHVVGQMASGELAPEPGVVEEIRRASSLPIRSVLRLSDGLSTTGAELTRLVGLAEEYLAAGASGLVFGFLTADLEIDAEVCSTLADAIPNAPWTFSRAIDHALDTDRAWRQVPRLTGLDGVLTAGSALGVANGLAGLCQRAESDAALAPLIIASGALAAEHVPWLAHSGITAFHVDSVVRPGGSWTKAYVDASFVRSWRRLLDDAGARQPG